MARLTSRIYLDYNSSSPLCPEVKTLLARGDFLWANPSSSHTSGKQTQKAIKRCRESISSFFHLPEEFDLIFHSGATEGINNVIKGSALQWFFKKKEAHFFFFATDHSAVLNQSSFIQNMGHQCHIFFCNKKGDIDWKNFFTEVANSGVTGPVFINITKINNETGFVFSFEKIEEIKRELKKIEESFLHIDMAQAPFKTDKWDVLSFCADALTFSGHKLGALKGTGFSFYKKSSLHLLYPLIEGGGQQTNIRSGTENLLGAEALFTALEAGCKIGTLEKIQKTRSYRNKIEDLFEQSLGEKVEVIRPSVLELRASNTILILFKGKKRDELLAQFDLEGLDIGTGSSCASLSPKASGLLLSMGYSEEEAIGAVRLSFNYFLEEEEFQKILEKLVIVISRLGH